LIKLYLVFFVICLLVCCQEGHPSHKDFELLQKPMVSWLILVDGVPYNLNYHMGTNSFSLSCVDAEDKDNWRLRIKGRNQVAQVYLEAAVKMVCLRRCVLPV